MNPFDWLAARWKRFRTWRYRRQIDRVLDEMRRDGWL